MLALIYVLGQYFAGFLSRNPPPHHGVVAMVRVLEVGVMYRFNFHVAHELRAWLLHYSAVVLVGYLGEDYYQHHLLLVEAVYLLLKDTISEGDILQSEHLLKHYCYLMGPLYGKSVHVHCLCHTT